MSGVITAVFYHTPLYAMAISDFPDNHSLLARVRGRHRCLPFIICAIRMDVVIVVPMAFFPLIPIAVNLLRVMSRRKKEMALNKGVQAIGDKSPQPDP